VTDSLQAATAFAIKTLWRTNAEEVVGGKSSIDSAKVAETNQDDISQAFSHHVTYIWNATNSVARVCNKRLHQAKSFSNLVPGVAVMGQTVPPLFVKKGQYRQKVGKRHHEQKRLH
jgi:hypothetical protein